MYKIFKSFFDTIKKIKLKDGLLFILNFLTFIYKLNKNDIVSNLDELDMKINTFFKK